MSPKKALVKDITLLTAILTIFFLILVVIYETTASQRDLAADLSFVFSNYKNNAVK